MKNDSLLTATPHQPITLSLNSINDQPHNKRATSGATHTAQTRSLYKRCRAWPWLGGSAVLRVQSMSMRIRLVQFAFFKLQLNKP